MIMSRRSLALGALAASALAFFFLAASSHAGLTVVSEAGAAAATVTNSIGVEFVLIPAGSFQMGTKAPTCPQDDPFTEKNERQDCLNAVRSDELPRHTVTIGEPFYMGKTEVTQEQWYAVMGTNPASFKTEKVGENSRSYPVETVSWNDAKAFIRKLNEKEGTTVYRLPTEAEWEYAARAGQAHEYAGSSSVGTVAWYDGNSGDRTHRVGTKAPNAWGLYDMSGNVWEWVEDWYHDSYAGAPTDGSAWLTPAGSYRVNRGGSWGRSPRNVRVAGRNSRDPGYRRGYLGFRLVRDAP